VEEATLHVYRQKTDDHQIFCLTQRLQVALSSYLRFWRDRTASVPLVARSLKSGELMEQIARRDPEYLPIFFPVLAWHLQGVPGLACYAQCKQVMGHVAQINGIVPPPWNQPEQWSKTGHLR
jgi:hypothetical protein